MKKYCKIFLSLILTFVLAFSLCIPAFAVKTSAKLYETYASGMLFKQNEEAVLAGTAERGSKITAEIKNSSGVIIANGEETTADDGVFNVKFHAPAGSFEEYTITLFENGQEFDKLENIVFGELWLASGQSNMDMPLVQSSLGKEMQANGKKLSKWIRLCYVPVSPEYNGSTEKIPYLPQDDIKGCRWYNGEDNSVYGFSAVGAFFAERLFENFSMPLGVVQSSLGGSTIRSWLSREDIDSSDVADILLENGDYISKKNWDENNMNMYADMSANYNKKIHPLKNFHFSGMIWYQGESDAHSDYGDYSKQLELLQKSYSKLFGFDGNLPLILTQLASYTYSKFKLQKFNIELTDFQQADPASRAVTTIYDVPLTYEVSIHAIHPIEKHQVGRRMAFCAEGLVYGKRDTYTAATVEKAEIDSNSIVVKLKNTGNGLKTNGDILRGFAVCGDDGVYLPADAEIIANDTVRIYSKQVSSPVSASYAVSQSNQRSNLYSDIDGYTFPVSPFITDKNYQNSLWCDNGWTDCDYDKMWRTHSNELTGYYDTWTAENADVSITSDSAFSGTGGLSVTSSTKDFSISPVTTYSDGKSIADLDCDFKKYKTMTFKVRNNGFADITFISLEIDGTDSKISPRIAEEKSFGTVIPADGNWYTVTLDLTKIYYTDFPQVISLRFNLEDINSFKFNFENESGDTSDISIDEIEFSTQKVSKNIFDLIKEFFVNIFSKIAECFKTIL